MQRWLTTLVGIAVVVLAVCIVVRNVRSPRASTHDLAPAAGGSGAASDDRTVRMYSYDGSALDGAVAFLTTDLLDRGDAGGGGTVLPDGMPVPPLPASAPRKVRFGVVLISYAGAQQTAAPAGASGTAPAGRSRADARTFADRLLATARQDFHAAVQLGDSGSTDDLGQVKPGILEPAPEYVLFTLPVDGVGGPVDTPRGYWIVKRLE